MDYVTRIHIKTDCYDRNELINFCLKSKSQCLPIGWSYIYEKNSEIKDFASFYYAVRDDVKRINHAFNVFWDAKEDDLFWTRDLDGVYWICRSKGKAQILFDRQMDIGAILSVDAYKVGLEVPGRVKASFNRPRGGIAEKIKEREIVEYSKHIYNRLSNSNVYTYEKLGGSLIDNLPDFDLEELVIAYLQVKENYYVLSNSIANKSTTVKIECELMAREKDSFASRAVVQVKGGKNKSLYASDFAEYVESGYKVYLFAPNVIGADGNQIVEITREDLMLFYNDYKEILPNSITQWEDLFML